MKIQPTRTTALWPMLAPAAVGLGVLAASGWLADPRVGYLAVCAIATVLGVVALGRVPATPARVATGVALMALAVATLFAARSQLRLELFARDPAQVAGSEQVVQQERLRAAVHDELETLRSVARSARRLPSDPGEAVNRLTRSLHDDERRAALVMRGDTLVVWAGTLHADPRAFTASSGTIASPFGLTLYVTDDSGAQRVIATSLLYATPPADRITKGLSQILPSDEVAEGFSFSPANDSSALDAPLYSDGNRPLFRARALVPSQGEVRFRLLERGRVRAGVAVLIALVAFLIAVAHRRTGPWPVVAGVALTLFCVAVIPLSEFSTRSRLFDATVYFFPAGRAFTANAAALALTSASALLLVLLGVRRIGERVPRGVAITIAALTVTLGPFAVRALSRGIAPPADGGAQSLWIIWSAPLCLAATALLVLANWAGRRALGARRGLPLATGPIIALVAASLAPVLWDAPGQWPQWYSLLWAMAVASLVLARSSHRALLACAAVAALAATTVVWASASRGRVDLAERDIRGLVAPDPYAGALADRLARTLSGEELPRTPQALLERYVTSDLASAGFPVALLSWVDRAPVASFGVANFSTGSVDTLASVADSALRARATVATTMMAGSYAVRVIAVPMRTGAVTIVVAPRTRLIGSDAYARWYGLGSTESTEPPYTVQVINDPLPRNEAIRWRREGSELHGDSPLELANGPARAHVEVDLRGLDTLLPRGGLIALLDVGIVSLVWLLGALADGRVGRWLRLRRRQVRSYRTRLSIALFLFFLVPAGAFAIWSWRQLYNDALAARRLLVTETMRAFKEDPSDPAALKREAVRLDTKLLLYQSGVLVATSDSLFAAFAPMGELLRPDVAVSLNVAEEVSATRPEALDGSTGMLGYRVLPNTNGTFILAAPARVDDILLDRRRRDLGVLVLFATALGAGAALWLSAIAGRQLARPIGALREAARAVARGESNVTLDERGVSEFHPVFSAFRAMTHDLADSRAALIEAQRRTDAVLRTVASGVIAVDESGRVILANPRAEAMLGSVPAPGDSITRLGVPAIAGRVAGFVRSMHDDDGFELERDGRTLRGQLTRLARGGAVLTLEDVTELARAQRVLAWGEMARQVAHEIKNPLTPIRLGVQHLQRAFGRPDYENVLRQNVSRILTEIDRLDEIARAFSRYGGAPEERAPAEATDVVAIVQDVVDLESLGEEHVQWSCQVEGEVPYAFARGDELREVLLNLFENARLAGATAVNASLSHDASASPATVNIDVTDNGGGISPDALPRIFEPHFSTRTSGSGLGLAITRRLVESWGGEIAIVSTSENGTTVRVTLLERSEK